MTTINSEVRDKLKDEAGYSDADIATMEKSSTLVNLLNKFKGTFELEDKYDGAYFVPHENKIVLGAPPYNDLVTLAHELGHATGSYQSSAPNAYATARDYAEARERGEGEAIAYQFKVGRELNPTYGDGYGFKAWYDNYINSTVEAYSKRLIPLLSTHSGKALYDAIGTLNAEMIASGGSGPIELTYGEDNILDYIATKKGLGDLNALNW